SATPFPADRRELDGIFGENGLGDLLNLAIADARRANADALSGALHQRANRLQVHVPTAFRYIVGMADAVAELRTAATNFANSCHKDRNLPNLTKYRLYQCIRRPGNPCNPVWQIPCSNI